MAYRGWRDFRCQKYFLEEHDALGGLEKVGTMLLLKALCTDRKTCPFRECTLIL